jgi:uncharacterized protein YukE
MSSIISVQLDALDALAGELSTLARELHEDAERCASAARRLADALSRDEGLNALWAAGLWASTVRAVSDATRAVADTLRAAIDAYRAAETVRARSIARHRAHSVAVAW